MIKNFIKKWLGLFEIDETIDRRLGQVLNAVQTNKNVVKSIDVMRHSLGSMSLPDHKDEMTEDERKEYCAAINAVFPRLKKDIEAFEYDQLIYSSNQAEDWDKVIFGRGTFNGMDILFEHWKKANQEHLTRTIPKQSFDRTEPIGQPDI